MRDLCDCDYPCGCDPLDAERIGFLTAALELLALQDPEAAAYLASYWACYGTD